MVTVIASGGDAVADRVWDHVLDGNRHRNSAVRHSVVDRLDSATWISAVVSDAATGHSRLLDQSDI